jgi:hypothetical protein
MNKFVNEQNQLVGFMPHNQLTESFIAALHLISHSASPPFILLTLRPFALLKEALSSVDAPHKTRDTSPAASPQSGT